MSIELNGTTGITTPDVNSDGLTVDSTTLVIDEANNRVGIGTSSPGTLLDVMSASNPTAKVRSNGGTVGNYAQLILQSYNNFSGSGQAYVRGVSSASGNSNTDLTFGVNASGFGAPFEAMRIDSSGNLLVGTTSAGAKLRVLGQDSTSSNNALVVANSSNTTLLQCRNDGYVFLPTTYNNTLGVSANLFVNTDGSLSRATSSAKYKREIVDARFGLNDALKLRPVNYKDKSTDSETLYGGLIAEEVHEAGLTEFVYYAEDGTPDALHYGNMVSLAFKAIQELKSINDAQAQTITAQQAALQEALTKIDSLETRIAALEAA